MNSSPILLQTRSGSHKLNVCVAKHFWHRFNIFSDFCNFLVLDLM
jgi:hypothetical protein